MSKSAILGSSIAKKYWMALTGLFLCIFLVTHLSGNLLLLKGDGGLAFNVYAEFMTTFPVVKIISYVLYFSSIEFLERIECQSLLPLRSDISLPFPFIVLTFSAPTF